MRSYFDIKETPRFFSYFPIIQLSLCGYKPKFMIPKYSFVSIGKGCFDIVV